MGDGEDRLNDWAKLVRQVRLARGLTQEQLADLVKVSRATVGRWETGVTIDPSAPTMKLFAAATGTDEETVGAAVLGARRARQAADDAAIREVRESDLPDEYKDEIIDHIIKRRAESEESLRRDIELMLRSRRAAAS